MILALWGTLLLLAGWLSFWLARDNSGLMRVLFYVIGVLCWITGVILWSVS